MNKAEIFQAIQDLLDEHRAVWSNDDTHGMAIVASLMLAGGTKGKSFIVNHAESPAPIGHVALAAYKSLAAGDDPKRLQDALSEISTVSNFKDHLEE